MGGTFFSNDISTPNNMLIINSWIKGFLTEWDTGKISLEQVKEACGGLLVKQGLYKFLRT